MATVISILKIHVSWTFLEFVLACCFISGITGDVPDGVVYTDLHLKAELGSRAVLKCEFYRTPLAVYWKKGDNPSSARNLITWAEGEPDSGSCVKDKTCEMGDDYSLIIKNVSIADQGRYICRVSNYEGILLHNFTYVMVFAVPEEPFPTINICMGNKRGNCTVHASYPFNITCIVSRYFPNVDLFFLHGDQKLATIETSEWTNADRTKNKAISTKAQPSQIPYVCVAFNIPGSRDQRTATISVISPEDITMRADTRFLSTITPFQHNASTGTSFTKFVLPIVIAVLGVVAVAVCLVLQNKYGKCPGKKRKEGDDEESQPMMMMMQLMDIKGHLSYYELWMLVSHAHAGGDHMKKLRDTFHVLEITGIESDCKPREAYQALCEWKDKRDN